MSFASHQSIVITRVNEFGVLGVRAHHPAFPELHAYGKCPTDAAKRLRIRLALTRESDLDLWERTSLERAIAEC
jgi:hypothetical protein